MHNGAITRSRFVSPSSRSNYKDSSTESEKAKKQDFSLEQSKTTACEPLSHQNSDNHKDAAEKFRLNSSNDSHRTIEENVGSHTSGGHNENNFTHNVSDEKNENGHSEASAKGYQSHANETSQHGIVKDLYDKTTPTTSSKPTMSGVNEQILESRLDPTSSVCIRRKSEYRKEEYAANQPQSCGVDQKKREDNVEPAMKKTPNKTLSHDNEKNVQNGSDSQRKTSSSTPPPKGDKSNTGRQTKMTDFLKKK